jgi:RNA polymerase sigma factor (sigma-70 family)
MIDSMKTLLGTGWVHPRARTGDPLHGRMLFDAVLAIVRKALERHLLSDADREDLAQEVAVVAWRRHSTYRSDRGNPEQWLSGIVRREVKRFLRMERKQPWFAAGDDLRVPAATSNPEDHLSQRDLAEHLLSMLAPGVARVVILVELHGLTFREAATREHISPSTAYEQYQRGMAALREAAERTEGPSYAEAIRVVSTGLGTDDWRVERSDGTYLCDIRIELSASYYGSRYYVIRDGRLRKEGTFTFDAWDDAAVRDVPTAIVRQTSPKAAVSVELPQRRAVGEP